jgi:hypothetical protein
VLDAWMWAGEPKTGKGKHVGVRESLRWVEGYQRLAELASKLPGTQLVYVADREADIMELMAAARDCGTPVDWLLRSQHNRAGVGQAGAVGGRSWLVRARQLHRGT